jgi:hypothetical protein
MGAPESPVGAPFDAKPTPPRSIAAEPARRTWSAWRARSNRSTNYVGFACSPSTSG